MSEPTPVVIVDGARVAPEAPVVGALDPGLLGQGVYESIRTYDGRPFALRRHLDRLTAGAEALDVPVDRAATAADVEAAAAALLAGGPARAEARVRVVLTAGGTRVVSADRLPDRRGDRERGVAAVSLPWPRPADGPTTGVKATSTAAARVGLAAARRAGAQTGLWLTPAGTVSEALAANVFAVVGGVLVTPALSEGALAGVTRALVLEWAAVDGVEVAEGALPLAALAGAPEAFLSATSEPVVPLVRLDGAPLGSGDPGPLSRRLQELFDRRVREGVEP